MGLIWNVADQNLTDRSCTRHCKIDTTAQRLDSALETCNLWRGSQKHEHHEHTYLKLARP